MEGLAKEVLLETYGIDTDDFDDEQLHDIIGLIQIELKERMNEPENN